MPEAPTLFFDVGGVLLTNGWDTAARRKAADIFGLDWPEFQTRHEMLKTAFETGRLSLDGYIKKVAYHQPRAFAPEDFQAFMFAQSTVLGDTLDWVRSIAESGRYRLFTLNNESRELHENRVQAFRLGEVFRAFFTSCYMGQVKPDEGIYLNALGMAGCGVEAAVFIDDRAMNVEPAHALGLNAVQFTGLDALREYLRGHGVEG